MFLGTHVNGVDAKGRVSTPAEFRGVVRQEGLEGVYCWPSIDGGYLEGCGADLMDRYQQKLRDRDPFDDESEDFAQVVLGNARLLKFDATGRVTLPKEFIAEAGLTDHAAFVGLGDKFQVWDPETRAAHAVQARDRLRRQKSARAQEQAVAESPHNDGQANV